MREILGSQITVSAVAERINSLAAMAAQFDTYGLALMSVTSTLPESISADALFTRAYVYGKSLHLLFSWEVGAGQRKLVNAPYLEGVLVELPDEGDENLAVTIDGTIYSFVKR
jgi:hypothetical protein